MIAALAGAAGAGPLDDARAADLRGDYATEFRLLRPLAEQGNAEAQTALGDMYAGGNSVPQDYVEAVKWFRRAAEQGFADAQDSLARMYVQGQGGAEGLCASAHVVQPRRLALFRRSGSPKHRCLRPRQPCRRDDPGADRGGATACAGVAAEMTG
jgi:TPR repeat protein